MRFLTEHRGFEMGSIRTLPFFAAFLFALSAGGSAALAQYSADDIVRHFSPKPATTQSGQKTRAVCIGTATQCGDEDQTAAAAPPADPGAFDMLITFELGSDRLSAQAQRNLREFASALQTPGLSTAVFNVDGHTDARGPDGFNDDLSRRRAAAVVEFLETLGVDRNRLVPRGFGETRPRDSDPFAAINRRVEATIRTR